MKTRKEPVRYKNPRLLEFAQTARIAVEFGSWYGKSAIAMCKSARNAGNDNFHLYCVDTWLGSIENWLREEGKCSKKDLMLSSTGRPQFYTKFINNINLSGVNQMITPLSMTTDIAATWLETNGIIPDLIYIDASHTYKESYDDIERALRIIKKGGIICGDDYEHEAGVKKAVIECFPDVGTEGQFWWKTIRGV